ncbi:MAG: type I-B CRISPR-associated protein Cas5 [Candidatus Delongbacteria bacterium]|nr:type I-B CRISPR-associated protein Cas5 [Candidatus Delongbacteria bacterium]
MQILVFDISAPLGHFKVPYTTTSPLTLPIPSKTSLYGMIGAIIGLEKDKYLKEFQDEVCKIGISVKSPIRKTHIATNLINTKNVTLFSRMDSSKRAPRSQIKIEFIKDSKFRLYFYHSNKIIYDKLKKNLSEHKSVYSISFGLSECLANFEFIGEFNLSLVSKNENWCSIESILPLENISKENLDLNETDKKYLRLHIPLEMKPDRELVKTGDFLVEANSKKIKAKNLDYYLISELNENVVLF